MTRTEPGPTSISRQDAIARLREELIKLTDEENCACKVAAEKGIFCNGFRRFSDADLRTSFDWIVRRRPEITRPELEAIANDWQLAQQQVRNLPLACDVQMKDHDTCDGWYDFTNEQLSMFYQQLLGEDVRIV